jgi:hypothetical protein
MLVGTFKWKGYAIPVENIAAIATIDESKQKLAEASFIVVGSIVGIILVVYIVRSLHRLNFGRF